MLWAGLAAIVLVLVWAVMPSRSGDSGDDPPTQKMGAQTACEDMVKDKLKSPSSAKFSDVTTTGVGPWTVTGHVDADNSFGAAIRGTWTCTVRLDGDYFKGSASIK